jgi:hypothetical protein
VNAEQRHEAACKVWRDMVGLDVVRIERDDSKEPPTLIITVECGDETCRILARARDFLSPASFLARFGGKSFPIPQFIVNWRREQFLLLLNATGRGALPMEGV